MNLSKEYENLIKFNLKNNENIIISSDEDIIKYTDKTNPKQFKLKLNLAIDKNESIIKEKKEEYNKIINQINILGNNINSILKKNIKYEYKIIENSSLIDYLMNKNKENRNELINANQKMNLLEEENKNLKEMVNKIKNKIEIFEKELKDIKEHKNNINKNIMIKENKLNMIEDKNKEKMNNENINYELNQNKKNKDKNFNDNDIITHTNNNSNYNLYNTNYINDETNNDLINFQDDLTPIGEGNNENISNVKTDEKINQSVNSNLNNQLNENRNYTQLVNELRKENKEILENFSDENIQAKLVEYNGDKNRVLTELISRVSQIEKVK